MFEMYENVCPKSLRMPLAPKTSYSLKGLYWEKDDPIILPASIPLLFDLETENYLASS